MQIVDWLKSKLGPKEPVESDDDRLARDRAEHPEKWQRLLCVCSEEMCFCTNDVWVPNLSDLAAMGAAVRFGDIPCRECKAGSHVWSPNGARSA